MARRTASVIDSGGTFTAGIVVTGSRGGHINFKSYPLTEKGVRVIRSSPLMDGGGGKTV
jgi:hypothetical protein